MTISEPAICTAARAAISCEGSDTYDAIVDPAGALAEQIQVAHAVSSCMLFRAWLDGWRGHFVGDTIQVTLRSLWGGTGRVPDVDNLCDVGAGIWWAASATAEEHVDACVVAVERHSLYAVTLTVIAGGQRVAQADVDAGTFPAADIGERCIAQRARTVTWTGSAWVDSATGRRVLGVRDAA